MAPELGLVSATTHFIEFSTIGYNNLRHFRSSFRHVPNRVFHYKFLTVLLTVSTVTKMRLSSGNIHRVEMGKIFKTLNLQSEARHLSWSVKCFLNSYAQVGAAESDDACVEFVIIAFETFDVFGVVVGRAILPAAPHDALPFEGQGAEGGVAAFAALALPLVIALGPDTKGEGRARHFVEGLAEELGTGPDRKST